MGKAMLFKVNRYEVTHEICAGPEGYQIHRDGVIVAGHRGYRGGAGRGRSPDRAVGADGEGFGLGQG
jgi:hypothetical protein